MAVAHPGSPSTSEMESCPTVSDLRDPANVMATFHRRRRLPPEDPARDVLRRLLIEAHLPFVRSVAVRYRFGGEDLDDLIQAGTVGLIKAVDRFDEERGVPFLGYAARVVVGEIRRHFRDNTWSVTVPRVWQELRAAVREGEDTLTRRLRRSPTLRELADHLGRAEEEVIIGLEAGRVYRSVSLSLPVRADDDSATLEDFLGGPDDGYEAVDNHESLAPLLNNLPPREQRVIIMRFYGNRSQAEIAADIGVSQMHVSRILARVCADLRSHLLA